MGEVTDGVQETVELQLHCLVSLPGDHLSRGVVQGAPTMDLGHLQTNLFTKNCQWVATFT